MAHRKQFYPPSTLAFMVVLVRVAFYATSIASLFFKLYSFLKITLLILKICFSKRKHKTSPNHIRCVARLITNLGRNNQKRERESQKFFEVSTLRLPPSLSAPSRAYLKSQQTRSRKRLPEELWTTSNVKIVIVFKNSLLAKHHMLHSHQIDLESVELILETWHSMQDKNTIKGHITLANIDNNMKNTLETIVKLPSRLILSHIVDKYQAGRR